MVSFLNRKLRRLKEEVRAIEGKEKLKQVIVVRSDLAMSKGKLAVQVAHGAVGSFIGTEHRNAEMARIWIRQGQKKVVVSVAGLAELDNIEKQLRISDLVFEKIADAGRTELAPGTATCIGIGPDVEAEIDKITGGLPLLK